MSSYFSFRSYLSQELRRRMRKNPRYSLRSFANQLEISPASLSRLLSGKQQPSEEIIDKICASLGLQSDETELLKAPGLERLPEEAFEVLANWYYLAILELVGTDDFRSDTKWISDRLGIQEDQIERAVDRLLVLGLLEIDEEGKWSDRFENFSTTSYKGTTKDLQQLQAQILTKSIQAVQQVPVERRDQSALTFAFDSERIDEARALCREFRTQMAELAASSANKDEVFQLSVSFFPLTQRG